ncbi:hypothetical protein UFOVP126_62 [uncultured Caudovirales phage]|jgi:hypothetical protein|uniref:Uncharacterized protein n=1 Tax=uncultured Caudovirales phage TaxID=2100421 RepID=A0A6J5LDY5_9CAUD|nr:hypothetical protein UFOVP126_62 [uncultured Caudovirales phage]
MSTQSKALRLADALRDGTYLLSVERDATEAELRRLHQQELALIQWLEKTEWVGYEIRPIELGQHRADVIQMRVARLHALNNDLLEALKMAVSALERSDYIQMDGDSFDVVDEAREAIARAEAA